MKKYYIISAICLLSISMYLGFSLKNQKINNKELTGMVINKTPKTITVSDNNDIIYTFNFKKSKSKIGEKVNIKYKGELNKNEELQQSKIVKCTSIPVSQDYETYTNEGLFKQFFSLAEKKLEDMTLDEKIGQLFIVRYQKDKTINDLEKYNFGGLTFFEEDFKDKDKFEVQKMLKELNKKSKIPLLLAVDEEGGTVNRVSINKELIDKPFKSPKELYNEGGFDLIKNDTIEKSTFLNKLGINLNLAPVVDVSTNPKDYIYKRTIGENTSITSKYAKTVIDASKNIPVSYVLKHFPGYGNNKDSHKGIVKDNRAYTEIRKKDFPPFIEGINSDAEVIMINHNIIMKVDPKNPASLSPSIHNILRNDLKFTGIIMTDDLSMKALSNIENIAEKAILAGNNILLTTNYENFIEEIKDSVRNKRISEDIIDNLVLKNIAWKYYKGMMYNHQK